MKKNFSPMNLIFVYNADSDFVSSVKDAARKFVSPQTYQCNLCQITYPRFAMDPEWKKFIEALPYKIEFLHRDEFRAQYSDWKDVHLPAIFLRDGSGTKILIDYKEINMAKNISELIKIVREHLGTPN